jgi:hypothetical protein
MLIPVSAGALRTACAALIEANKEQLEGDKAKLAERSYDQLRAGAVHNGTSVTPEREKEMREMVGRDVEHMLDGHPSKEIIEHCNVMLAAATYVYPGEDTEKYDEVVIDMQEFQLLSPHLPPKE